MRRSIIPAVFITVLLVLFLLPLPAQSARLVSGNQASIGTGETVRDDLYISGGTVLVDGNIMGDLIVAGGNVTVNGTVQNDIIAAGGTVVLNGRAGDDIRVAGGNITVNAPIADDLVVAGGTVTMATRAAVGGDVIAWGGTVSLSAPVRGRIQGGAGDMSIGSTVGGGVNVTVDSLRLGSGAVINGDLIYRSQKEAQIAQGARVTGRTTRLEPMPGQKDREGSGLAAFLGFLFWWALSLILTGLVLIYLLPALSLAVIMLTWRDFWRSAGIGFLVLVAVPVASLLLMITVIGIPLAMVLLAAWCVLLYLAMVYAAIFTGWAVISLLRRQTRTLLVWGLLLGAFLFPLLHFVPFIGWLAAFLLFLAALGSLCRVLYGWRAERECVEARHPVAEKAEHDEEEAA